jgi:hypothetical protein
VGNGHHLHPHAERLLLPCGDNGFGKQESAVMAGFKHIDTSFCIEALEEALQTYGAPEIFNTDQEASLPLMILPRCSRIIILRSAWTAKADG